VRRLLHVKKWSTSLFESDLTQFWLNSPLIAMADVRSVTDHADGVKKQALTALPPGSEERVVREEPRVSVL
jgi:hypothetical protein